MIKASIGGQLARGSGFRLTSHKSRCLRIFLIICASSIGDYFHFSRALGTDQKVSFIDFLDKASSIFPEGLVSQPRFKDAGNLIVGVWHSSSIVYIEQYGLEPETAPCPHLRVLSRLRYRKGPGSFLSNSVHP